MHDGARARVRARARYIVYAFYTQAHNIKSKTKWGTPSVKKKNSLVPTGDHLNVEYTKTHTECTTARARTRARTRVARSTILIRTRNGENQM